MLNPCEVKLRFYSYFPVLAIVALITACGNGNVPATTGDSKQLQATDMAGMEGSSNPDIGAAISPIDNDENTPVEEVASTDSGGKHSVEKGTETRNLAPTLHQ